MTLNGLVQIMFYFIVLLGLAKPLGWYMARVYEGRACGLDRILFAGGTPHLPPLQGIVTLMKWIGRHTVWPCCSSMRQGCSRSTSSSGSKVSSR